jgi:hypothetical protein
MSMMQTIVMRMFGRPQGVLGRLGGTIMARANAACGAWLTELLENGLGESVLEVGFGPGVVSLDLRHGSVESPPFGAAERRLDANAYRRRIHRRAYRGER